jgi:PAS domain S-box-containing protein
MALPYRLGDRNCEGDLMGAAATEMMARNRIESALRALHEITSDQDRGFNDKVKALLATGCQIFGLPIGILSWIRSDRYHVVEAVCPDDSLKSGREYDLEGMYCRETLNSDDPVAFEHAAASPWVDHPCYVNSKLEAYLGLRVIVGRESYGTLCFAGYDPRDTPFSSTDREIIRLMAQWVGGETARRRAEERFRLVFEAAPTAMVMVNRSGDIVLSNAQTEKLFGYTTPELIGRPVDILVPERLRTEHKTHVAEFFNAPLGKTVARRELSGLRKDRTEIPVEIGLSPIETGEGTLVLSAIVDLSERNRAETALRQSEARFRDFAETAADWFWETDSELRFTYFSERFREVFGESAQQAIGSTRKELFDQRNNDPKKWEQHYRDLIAHCPFKDFEYLLARTDGAVRVLRTSGKPVFDEDGVFQGYRGVGSDVTERKRAQEMFRLVVESAPNAMVVVNSAGKIVLVNKQTETLFGYPRDELIGHPVEILVPEQLRARHPDYRTHFQAMPQARAMGSGRDLHARRKDGSEISVEIGLSPVETEQETLILGAVVDITERKQASQQLQRIRSYLQNIIDSMPSILVGVDAEGQITAWNKGAELVAGICAEEATGQRFVQLLPWLQSQAKKVADTLRTGQALRTERLVTERAGETHFWDVVVYPLGSEDRPGAVIRVDDITSRVRIEQLLVQNEKMMSLGGLAAGMAHEINNPLSAILQNCQNIRRRLSGELRKNQEVAESLGLELRAVEAYLEAREVLRALSDIQEAGVRTTKIVTDMLAFSRSGQSHFARADLSKLCDTAVRLATSDYELKKKYDFKDISIERDYDPSLEGVYCDETGIEQVILNLLKNAAQAMAAGNHQRRAPKITLRTRKQSDCARIEVIDNGPGMDEETRQRALEPFFTTKAVGEGTGLGLSVSYFIITEQHAGTLTVESAPGQGARFIIQLPLERVQGNHSPTPDRTTGAN